MCSRNKIDETCLEEFFSYVKGIMILICRIIKKTPVCFDFSDMSISIDGNEKIVSSKMPNPEITVHTNFYIGSKPFYEYGKLKFVFGFLL